MAITNFDQVQADSGFIGNVTGNLTGMVASTVSNALTAVGTNRATALALTSGLNFISTAAASTGVVLTASATLGIGGGQTVYNAGASAIKVYAAGSDTIDGVAGATGVTLSAGARCRYTVNSAGTFISSLLGAVSA